MADGGLINGGIGGIGSGLSSFADTYLKAKSMQQENDRNQQYVDLAKQNAAREGQKEQAGLLAQGMQTNPDSGQVEYNPEQQQIKEQEKQQRLTQQAQDKLEMDPNSENSKRGYELRRQSLNQLQEGAGDKMVPKGASESEMKKYDQLYEKMVPGFAAKIKAQSNEGIADTRADATLQAAKTRAASRGAGDSEKIYSDTVGKMNNFRGNKAVANANDALRNVSNAEELLKQYPDLNKMPQAQVNLLNDELAKIAGGGAATEGGRKELNSSTFESALQNFKARAGNEPTGAQLGDFLKNNVQYLGGLKKANQGIVNSYRRDQYDANEHRLNKEQQARFKKKYPELFAQEQAAESKSPTPQAQQAPAQQAPPQEQGGLLSRFASMFGGGDKAASGPHGPSVTQNGHTYTWNPTTKAYE